MKKFILALVINFTATNIPFVFFGMLLGWPSALLSSIIHGFYFKKITISKSFIVNMLCLIAGGSVNYYFIGLYKEKNIFLSYLGQYIIFGFFSALLASVFLTKAIND